MKVVPLQVGTASRDWDEQHLDLASAATQIGDAPTSGFTKDVAGAAGRFTAAWQRHVQSLADEAETRADGLRDSIRDYLETDGAVADAGLALASYLAELR
ncbi:hypothetical protein [Nocardioides pacificus]